MSPGEKIKKYRKTQKLTQEQLAEKVGVSKNSIWNYENNKVTIDHKTLVKIARALKIRVNDILGLEQIQLELGSNFVLADFDPEMVEVFYEQAAQIRKLYPEIPLSDSLILHNILIDYLARFKAETSVYKRKSLLEFSFKNFKFLTGMDLFDKLYIHYKHEFEERIKEANLNEILNQLKEFKDEPPSDFTIKQINKFIKKYGEDHLPFVVLLIYREYQEDEVGEI